MPTMASITVKKADETTNIVYDALTASGGETSPAVWRQDTGAAAGLPVGLRATLSLSTKWNGAKTARQGSFKYERPYATQNSTTTLFSESSRVVISGLATMPIGMPASEISEGVRQACNLLASTLIKQALETGYSPA